MSSVETYNQTPSQAAAPRAGQREWIGLFVLMLPAMLIAMDMTVLHLAVPSLSADLKPGSAQLLWIVDIYGFLIAGSLITMGTLGDRIGRRKLLMIGAAAFACASILAAFSPSAEILILTRAILGVAGATLMPSTMSLIRNMFHDPEQRTFAIGVWISSFSVGAAVGPLVGGFMLQFFWWGSVFLLAVPVMALLLALGPLLLPEFRDPRAGRLDIPSAALSLASVLALIFGVKQTAEHGLTALALTAIAAGLVTGFVFVQRQRGLADPLIDLRLFLNRAFTAALAVNTVGIFAMFGVYLFIPQYLQLVIGLTPLEAGLWTVPGSLVSIAGSLGAPALLRWFRPRPLIFGGLVVAVAGLLLLTQVSVSSLGMVVAGLVIISLGFGVVFTLTVDVVVGAAPPERAGAASAISETGSELGGALGIAVLGSLGVAIYRRQVAALLPSGISPEAAETARDTLGGAVNVAAHLSDTVGPMLLQVSREAFVDGLQLVAVCAVVLVLGLAVLAAFWLGQHEPGAPAHAASDARAAGERGGLPASYAAE
ncbi:MAG: MFS transporter [Chloroflexi bacterium]|nr:MFS transporter [Chloroflexota bacterium]